MEHLSRKSPQANEFPPEAHTGAVPHIRWDTTAWDFSAPDSPKSCSFLLQEGSPGASPRHSHPPGRSSHPAWGIRPAPLLFRSASAPDLPCASCLNRLLSEPVSGRFPPVVGHPSGLKLLSGGKIRERRAHKHPPVRPLHEPPGTHRPRCPHGSFWGRNPTSRSYGIYGSSHIPFC